MCKDRARQRDSETPYGFLGVLGVGLLRIFDISTRGICKLYLGLTLFSEPLCSCALGDEEFESANTEV